MQIASASLHSDASNRCAKATGLGQLVLSAGMRKLQPKMSLIATTAPINRVHRCSLSISF
jgi:hypothetical protein